jgi:hypothetical protein
MVDNKMMYFYWTLRRVRQAGFINRLDKNADLIG